MGFPRRTEEPRNEVPAPAGAAEAMCWDAVDETAPIEEQRVFHWDPEFFRAYGPSSGEVQTVSNFKQKRPQSASLNGRNIIYIMPLGQCWVHGFSSSPATQLRTNSFRKGRQDATPEAVPSIIPPQLDILRRYLGAFFHGIPVILLDPQPLPVKKKPQSVNPAFSQYPQSVIRTRINENNPPGRRIQKYAPDLLRWIQLKAPADAFCTIGITHVDLYKDPAVNHCVGSSSENGVAVLSFARLEPSFFGYPRTLYGKRLMPSFLKETGQSDANDDEPATARHFSQNGYSSGGDLWYMWLSKRVCRYAAHLLLHSLGLKHCYVFICLMNEDGIEDVNDSSKSLLCPICLKKFQVATSVETLPQLQALGSFCQDFQSIYGGEGSWICGRFEWIAHGVSRVRLPISTPTETDDQEQQSPKSYCDSYEPSTQLISATVPQIRQLNQTKTKSRLRRSSGLPLHEEPLPLSKQVIWTMKCFE